MARTDALSIKTTNDSTAAKLIEVYGKMIEPVKAQLISAQLKNNNYSGSLAAGSVEVYRLQTAVSKTYGTARGAGAGDKVKKDPTTVNLNVHKEIVEEWKKGEAEAAGIDNLVAGRRVSHQLAMVTELDTAFFAEAVSAGTEVDVSAQTTLVAKVEKLIQTVEATTNEYIEKGVNRAFLALSLTPEYYDLLEDYINTLPNPADGGVKIEVFKRVRVFVNLNQTVDAIVMAMESIAQPVNIFPYAQSDIDLSNDTAVTLFYDYGTEAVMPDLIAYASLGDEVSA
jgi:hypothetical protein